MKMIFLPRFMLKCCIVIPSLRKLQNKCPGAYLKHLFREEYLKHLMCSVDFFQFLLPQQKCIHKFPFQ